MQINLSGSWKATKDLGVQSRAGKPGYEPAGWLDVHVPGHWQDTPGLERYTGRLLYRRSFQFEGSLAPGELARLRFEGIFYEAKVWMNGAFLGEHKGYFVPEMYDVTKHLRTGENVVMVEVDCPAEESRNSKELITGVFSDWACKDPAAEPGGIWRPVWLEIYHGVVPERFLLQAVPDRLPPAPMAPDELEKGDAPAVVDGPLSATVSFDLEFSAFAEGKVTWTATVTPETFQGEPILLSGSQPARRGWNRLTSALSMMEPRLWWTWDHGEPHLYRFTLELSHEGGPVQTISRVFGVRKVELRKWHFYLNGRRIFLRGTNYGPADIRLARVSRAWYQQDLDLMTGANMNLVRLHAHVDQPDLYEEASRKGILIWQDFPLHGLYSRSIREEAERQARIMVETLGHWPAIGFWCCHSDPVRAGERDDPGVLDKSLAVLSQLGGNWNKSTLAPALRDVIRKADPTRPCISHSGDWGVIRGGTDTHHYWGWYTGRVEDLAKVLKSFPDTARFVTEFGAQAFPSPANSRRFVRGEWPNVNWSALAERHMLQPKTMERHIPHSLAQTFEQYVGATQRYQAFLHKFYIEQFRRRKYHPTGGVLQFLFTDSSPGVTWAIVDYWREPKLAYEVVRDAFRPVYILADWPQPGYPPGGRIALQVWLVNDHYQPYRGTWTWAVQREEQVLAADTKPAYLPPDSAALAPAGVEWSLPQGLEPGTAELVLTLNLEGEEPVSNRYAITILPPI